jgi:Transcriptional regulator, AbiEi antitoxin
LVVDHRIAALAARQHGLVTFAQLRRLGLSRGAIRHRVVSAVLHRVHVGVYAVGHPAISPSAQLLGAVMACGDTAVLSHVHAAHLWRLLPPWIEVELAPTHVTVPPACGRGRRPAC